MSRFALVCRGNEWAQSRSAWSVRDPMATFGLQSQKSASCTDGEAGRAQAGVAIRPAPFKREAGNRMLGSLLQTTQSVQPSESVSRSGRGQEHRLARIRSPSSPIRQLSPSGSDNATGPDHSSLPYRKYGFSLYGAFGGCLSGRFWGGTLPYRLRGV